MINFIHAPVWSLMFLNKYLFFIYPPLLAQKEIIFHDMMKFRLKSRIFIFSFFYFQFTKLQI